MDLLVRKAAPADAASMAALINPIIEKGGTTAYETPFTPLSMEETYITSRDVISCVVAEGQGELLGFQGLFRPDAYDELPVGWGSIATFADIRSTGRGVGRKLFAATVDAAKEAGVQTIDATIRADNDSGLGFYARMGFRDYDRIVGVPLKSGALVDRIRKRFDL